MEPGYSLLHLNVTTTCPYPEPNQSSPQPPPHSTSWISILISSSHLFLSFKWSLSLSFPTKTHYAPLPSPYLLHASPISFFLTWSYKQYWVGSTGHSAPHSVVFSTPRYLVPLFSTTLSLYSSFNVSDHISHPHKTTGKVQCCIPYSYIFG